MNVEIKKYPIADSIGFSSRRGVKVLSNMDCSCKLYYKGVEYNSVEQLFHVLIYQRVAELAMQCKNGKEVKRLNALYMEDRDYRWDSAEEKKRKRQQYYQDMYDLLHLCHQVKFKYNAEFRKVILESGDKHLVEDCHWLDGTRTRSDLYGTRRDQKNGVFIGRNINGQSLEELREEVRESQRVESMKGGTAEKRAKVVSAKQNLGIDTPIYTHHELTDKDVLTKRHRVKMWVKGKCITLYVQRVCSSVYDRFGFSQYHYIDKPINKGAMCLLFTDKKNRPIAFVGLLNHTFKGCRNGIMVSRFVILPKFQKRGLSLPILKAVGGMLSASGYQMYINTQNKQLGEALGRRKCFVGTTFDQVDRSGEHDKTHRNRIWGKAWRKKYCGGRLYGYSELFRKVDILRKKVSKNSISNDNIHSKILYPIDSLSNNRHNSPNLAICSLVVDVSNARSIVVKESVCNASMASCCMLMGMVGESCFNTS